MPKNKLIVFTTHCPRCDILIDLLKCKGIEHNIIDDEATVMNAAEAYGMTTVPFCREYGTFGAMDFQQSINYINSL